MADSSTQTTHSVDDNAAMVINVARSDRSFTLEMFTKQLYVHKLLVRELWDIWELKTKLPK